MRKRLYVLASGLLLTGGVMIAALHAAPPPCSKKTCSAAIAACVDSACGAFSGKDLHVCKSDCTTAVTTACEADPTVCTPSPSGAFLE
jgi:hypothetical protein